jgi:hypothetical protein
VRKYPIHDRSHARAALSMAARKNTYGSYAHVAAKVKARYPDIGGAKTSRGRKTGSSGGKARRSSTRRRSTRR